MQQGGTMSIKITTTLTTRRPTLIRVWRATGQPGTPLTSTWFPTLTPSTNLNKEGGPRL
jgi:hypothetical protein